VLDGSAAVLGALTSTDYGLKTAQIKIKIEAASLTGLKVTTGVGAALNVQDNVYRNAFSVQYTGGQASGVMTINNSTVTLQAPTGTTVATIDLNTYPTIQQLVDRVNTTAGFVSTVLEGNGPKASLNALDSVTAVDVRTALYTATAHLQAFADYINGPAEPLLNFVRAANVGTLPAVIGFTYLAGGTEGTSTNTDWSNSFTAMQQGDVQWISPQSGSAAISAMADTHVQFMSGAGRRERRAICGTVSGTTDVQAIAAARLLNSDRTALTHLGGYDYDVNGNLVLYQPYLVAAMIAGVMGSVSPGTPGTNKSLRLRGMERNLLTPTDTDLLIQGGVLCVESAPDGFKIVKSNSTWLSNNNFNRVELSCGFALDYTVRTVRNALKVCKGAKGSPAVLGTAISVATGALKLCAQAEPQGPGAIVGDVNNPAFRGLTASLVNDEVAVQFQCSPAIPANFVDITVYAVPYSGSLSASA
jgi:hypothetical protein